MVQLGKLTDMPLPPRNIHNCHLTVLHPQPPQLHSPRIRIEHIMRRHPVHHILRAIRVRAQPRPQLLAVGPFKRRPCLLGGGFVAALCEGLGHGHDGGQEVEEHEVVEGAVVGVQVGQAEGGEGVGGAVVGGEGFGEEGGGG